MFGLWCVGVEAKAAEISAQSMQEGASMGLSDIALSVKSIADGLTGSGGAQSGAGSAAASPMPSLAPDVGVASGAASGAVSTGSTGLPSGLGDLLNGMLQSWDGAKDALAGVAGSAQETQALIQKSLGEAWNEYIQQPWDDFKMSVLLWVVVGVVALVVFFSIFDGIRHAIKGLDVALLGVLFCWASQKVPDIVLLQDLKEPGLIIGVVLVVVGLAIFIFTKIFRGLRKRK